MRIYNSLTKKKEEFIPVTDKIVNMYSCGVTVYDKCHIGHARSLYIFDVIRKHFKSRGYDVRLVRNITDVDDKIIKKSNDSGKTFEEVVKENIDLYHNDLRSLDIDVADIEPRATENIPAMVDFIEKLIEKDFAYEVDGDIYFSVRKFKNYGELSGQSIDKMLESVRVGADLKKKDPLDFILWKKAKDGEPSWEGPLSLPGRPGWHIECSVMSMKELGCETLDIHAGGRDLIFPHHENEIAQSEALTGKKFANYWIHHGLLKINGQKMAKSLGNFITVEEVLARYSHNVLKLFFLQSHYASEIDFTWEKMEECEKVLDKIQDSKVILSTINDEEEKRTLVNQSNEAVQYWEKFLERMDNDFNTPQALSVLFDFIKYINSKNNVGFVDGEVSVARAILENMAKSLGLSLTREMGMLSDEEQNLLNQRAEARENKDFQMSDKIRDQLKDMGIVVEDGKDGQKWRKI